MTNVSDTFKRKERVEEDLYFAKRDRELVKAMYDHHAWAQIDGAIVIVSGGQSGVDRAALDAARAVGLPIAGWCPRGRRAEDGPIAEAYPLRETPSADYAERTAWNIRDSDATMILYRDQLSGGSLLTARLARRDSRPLLTRDLAVGLDPDPIVRWLVKSHVRVLNCAGPRESGAPGIHAQARGELERLFSAWAERTADGG